MNVCLPVAKAWQQLKQTGLMLVFINMLTLLFLLSLVGAVIGHAPQGDVPPAVPHGSLMAPVSGGSDPGPTDRV